ncbi:response regulator [Alteraurantiacibacter aestuarii]|uniref:response regulator n=1 Tax=Alteraurantiacibacter aestuarii TaxID=650004 RepID=UPI0031DF5BAA
MSGGLKKVLYVEDDSLIAELAIMTMEDFADLTVLHCSSGPEALEAVSQFSPDLILLDVMMPNMDGMETLRRLRAMPDIAHTPAVFMSAKVQTHECESYLKAGACGVISKPFDPRALSDKLQDLWAAATHCTQLAGNQPAG